MGGSKIVNRRFVAGAHGVKVVQAHLRQSPNRSILSNDSVQIEEIEISDFTEYEDVDPSFNG